MAFGPGLPVGRRSQANLVQQGNQAVGIRRLRCALIGIGRGVLGAQRGNIGCVHGRSPCKATAPPLTKAADGTCVETGGRVIVTGGCACAHPTHRPPWNANGLPAGATQRRRRPASAYIWYIDGFSSPAPPFSCGTPRDTRAATKCQGTTGLMIASPDVFGIVAHGVKPASDCATRVLKGLALLAPSAGMPAATVMA